jgi:hypothetical protein
MLIIPANTPEHNAIESEIEVEGSIIKSISILIPPGHCALAHIALMYGNEQIFPSKRGQYIEGDDETIYSTLNWKLPESPCKVKIVGWNEDDTYQHLFIVRFEVAESMEEAFPELMLMKVVKSIASALALELGVSV